MNAQIVKLFGLIVVLFALLVIFTTRWTVIDATALDANPLNSRTLIAELKIKRGEILAGDGTVLAKSVSKGGGVWGRTYPTGSLFAQPVGYCDRPGGQRRRGSSAFAPASCRHPGATASIFGPLGATTGRRHRPDDARPQGPGDRRAGARRAAGSVVAINPQTGAI